MLRLFGEKQKFNKSIIEESKSNELDILNKLSERRIPASITIELTERCNERCIHCYRPDYTKNEYWSLERFNTLCESLISMGTLQLDITGGEPFLNKDITSYIDAAASHDFIITILTNGTLINNEHINSLSKAKVRNVYISLYGENELIHDQITRVTGSFRKTIASISALRAVGIPVCINTPVMKINKKSTEGIKSIADKFACEIKFTYKISSSYSESRDSASLNSYSTDSLLSAMKNEKIKLYSDIVSDKLRKEPLNRDKYCDAGRRSFAISPHGELMICTALRMPCGNLKKDNVLSIWNNSKELTEWRYIYSKINKKCSSCKKINYCEPCPAWFYSKTGRLDGIDSNTCNFGQALYNAVTSINKA